MQRLEQIVVQLSDLWERIQTSYQTGSVPVKLVRAYLNTEIRQEINCIGKEVKALVADVRNTSLGADNFLHSNSGVRSPEKTGEVNGCRYQVVDENTENPETNSINPNQKNDYALVVR